MTPTEILIGVAVGLVAGVLSGLFGVGGGIVMTPGINVFLSTAPIVALATPLPVILPTALMGAATYGRAGAVDIRAAAWMGGCGIIGVVGGWWITGQVNTHWLLILTAALLVWQSIGIIRGRSNTEGERQHREATPLTYAGIGIIAGLASGMLGIGGGLVMVPLTAGWLGMPIKTAFGTSLLAIVALAIPGTILHAWSGNIDWAIFLAVTVGAVPGARIGARVALGTRERTLRLLVGSFLLVIGIAYGVSEAWQVARR
jgi:uncharacterized membrane protein YfcA